MIFDFMGQISHILVIHSVTYVEYAPSLSPALNAKYALLKSKIND